MLLKKISLLVKQKQEQQVVVAKQHRQQQITVKKKKNSKDQPQLKNGCWIAKCTGGTAETPEWKYFNVNKDTTCQSTGKCDESGGIVLVVQQPPVQP